MTQPVHPKESQLIPEPQGSPIFSGSNAGSIAQSRANSATPYFDLKNKISVKPIIFTLFKLLDFICNFNYSVENALITMMMITFLTPNIIDSLIWIIPNIVSIIIRPYLIRYVHKTHKAHRIRSEAFLINILIVLVAVGSFLIGQSGLMNNSKKGLHVLRILVCSVGWTLTGMSLELVQYFSEKLKESFQNQCYINNVHGSRKEIDGLEAGQQFGIINFKEQEQKQTLTTNWKFIGSLLGYLVVLALFMFPLKNIKKIPSYFTHSSLIYNINTFLTLFSAIIFYSIVSYSGLPKPDPQLKPKPVSYRLSYSLNYYLPGFLQLRSISLRGLAFLAIHFMMIFVMDVMFIYTTMWTAGSVQAEDMKTSEANFYGVERGVLYLIVFTYVYYSGLFNFVSHKSRLGWKVLISASSILFLVCFWFMRSLFFLPLIIILAISFKTYENTIEPLLQEIEPQIQVCKEVVIRIQKVAVLNVLPFISMIILGRDDIQDCMVCCSLLLIATAVLFTVFVKEVPEESDKTTESEDKFKEKKE